MANRITRELIKTQNAKYDVGKPLATGTFGALYKAKRDTDGKVFAIKCESLKMKHSLLRQASVVMSSIHYPSPHFCTIEECGTVPARFLFIVMTLYGENVAALMNENATRKFSAASALHIAEQSLIAIRDLHRNGFIHRDIKPTHFCVGREDEENYHFVYMIDFGLCKRPRSCKKGDEVEDLLRKNAIVYRGVVKYASLNAHNSKPLGYRDDMEAWWYMVLEFFLGVLPWQLLNKRAEKEVVKIKAGLNEQSLGSLLKINKEAVTTFYEMLTIIRAPSDICEFVDYDRVADCIRILFDKLKVNPAEPPDWDGLSDYKGPAYQPVVMTPPAETIALPVGGIPKKDAFDASNEKVEKVEKEEKKEKKKKSKKKKNGKTIDEDAES